MSGSSACLGYLVDRIKARKMHLAAMVKHGRRRASEDAKAEDQVNELTAQPGIPNSHGDGVTVIVYA